MVTYINQQLKAAGVETRVAHAPDRLGAPQTITAGGSTITLASSPDQYAMTVDIGTSETVTFSAPQTAGAVYVAQTSGDPNPDKNPLTTADSDTRSPAP